MSSQSLDSFFPRVASTLMRNNNNKSNKNNNNNNNNNSNNNNNNNNNKNYNNNSINPLHLQYPGVTSLNPSYMNLPRTLTDLTNGTWMLSGDQVLRNKLIIKQRSVKLTLRKMLFLILKEQKKRWK